MSKGPRGVSDFGNSTWPRNGDGTFRASISGPRKARKIRYHDDEWDRVVASARACGMPAATFVRRVSLGAQARVRRNQTQNDLIVLLGRISADLQGLARHARQVGDRRMLLALDRARNETLAAIRRIG